MDIKIKEESKENQIVNIDEKINDLKNNPAKMDIDQENKGLESQSEQDLLNELPVPDENNSVNNKSIKDEIQSNQTSVQSKKMDIEEFVQNAEVKRIKTDQADLKRRRSLRNETAATIKKKPPKYEEIFNCYKRKEYKECIIYIDLVAESAKDWIEYQILKAACLIHLGIKLTEAHKILDDIMKIHNTNPFSFYAKGLAYFQEEKYKDSVKYLEKAISLDKSSMQRAEIMLKLAKEELEKADKGNEPLISKIKPEPLDEEELDDQDMEQNENDNSIEQNDSKLGIKNKSDRFRCEICMKSFCKKFNLDRHNKIMHNRETPYIPPLPRNNNRRSAPETISQKVDDISDDSPVHVSKAAKFKIKLGKKIKKAQSLSTLTVNSEMGRCKICKKLYRKGSLARHEIIHTGNKQFKCEECPMAFYQKSDLQRHVTIHSNIFEYDCELCDKKFRIKKNLQVHNRRHHSK